MWRNGARLSIAASLGACVALVVAGCTTVVEGRVVSTLYDPTRVGGLPAVDGPSGIRDNAPKPTGKVLNSNSGDQDNLVLSAVNDIEEFWDKNYDPAWKGGSFTPVDELVSYDSTDKRSPIICSNDTYGLVNAFYAPKCNLIAWDRGKLVPIGQKFFGDMSIPALIGHEYGHSVQYQAGLVKPATPVIVAEQQADCFSGAYMRWVAEGQSKRFTVSTSDGLNKVLAAGITIADPILTVETSAAIEQGHGTALDRVSAFQMGFVTGIPACAAIDLQEIEKRRGNEPLVLPSTSSQGDVEIDKATLTTLMDVMGKIYSPKAAPTLSYESENCSDAKASPPASYCPASNTIYADLSELQKLGTPAGREDEMLIQGDNTALSIVMSRYTMALQHERGVALDNPTAALRTACMTGVGQRKMSDPGNDLQLSAGDLDEAVAGLLTNGLVASDVNGKTVPAGFTRILAFRSGVQNEMDNCFDRFR